MASVRPKGRPLDLGEGEMRDRLLVEGAKLFAEVGYAGTSIQAIVDAAGTTKPMVYYYFKGKEGLYRELARAAYDRVRDRLEQISAKSGDIESRLEAVIQANFELFHQAPDLVRFALIPLLSPRKDAPEVDVKELGDINFGLMRRIVAEGIERGEIEGNSIEIALTLAGQITIYIMAQLTRPHLNLLNPEGARKLVRLLLNGARPRG